MRSRLMVCGLVVGFFLLAGCQDMFGSRGQDSGDGSQRRTVQESSNQQGEERDSLEYQEMVRDENIQGDTQEDYSGQDYPDEVLPVEEEYESAAFDGGDQQEDPEVYDQY